MSNPVVYNFISVTRSFHAQPGTSANAAVRAIMLLSGGRPANQLLHRMLGPSQLPIFSKSSFSSDQATATEAFAISSRPRGLSVSTAAADGACLASLATPDRQNRPQASMCPNAPKRARPALSLLPAGDLHGNLGIVCVPLCCCPCRRPGHHEVLGEWARPRV